ncbi:MAG: mechanosensitive ion channel family protein [Oscillospiraceae bacterium]
MLTDDMGNLTQNATFFEEMLQKGEDFLPTLLVAVLVFLLGLLLTRVVLKIVDRAMRRAKVEGAASSFIKSLLRILLYTLLAIVALSILGVPMTSIIAVISAAGLAIGLALQDSLSNLAGGFIILFSKPFKAGDYIMAGGTEGHVDSVSILYTKLITRDNRSVYLPNGVLSSGQITNLSQRGTLRVSVPLTIAYNADFDMARQIILEVLANEPMVLQDPAPVVTMSGHGDNAVMLNAGFWVNSGDYFAVSGRIYESSKQAFDAAGIEIPYPQICVHNPM